MDQVQIANRNRKFLQQKRSEIVRKSVLGGLEAFVLGGGIFMGQALPLGACFVAAQSPGVQAVGTTIGAIVGYFLRCEPAEAVEYTGVSLLMLFTLFLFQGTDLSTYAWFMPLCCSLTCAVMGGVGLLGSEKNVILPWLGKAVLGSVGTYVFRKTMEESVKYRVLFFGAIVFSLVGPWRYIDIGLLVGTAISAMSGSLLTAVVMGISLDLGANGASYMTVAMVLPGVVCRVLGIRKPWITKAVYGSLPCGAVMLLGEGGLPQIAAAAIGACIGLIFMRASVPKATVEVAEEKKNGGIHEHMADVLDALRQELPMISVEQGREAEQIYDAVGERICRTCVRYGYCWGTEGGQTYEALSAAAPYILKRGVAREEDFSKNFRERCCAFPTFLCAVNGELEGVLYRRRYEAELRENRRILDQEYSLLAQIMRNFGENRQEGREKQFTPIVSTCSGGRKKARISGDRSSSFMAPDGNYYVILCDGMGTGEEAACLSGYALHLLETFLKNGVSPEASMKLLNGNMLLRGIGAFSTVDLLRLDLNNGEAYVYKWGAAPSFWTDGDRVCKIGNPTPPPGVGIGDRELPESFRLSMKKGQLLVLISDGAYNEETENVVGTFRTATPRELAAILVSDLDGEDDVTAIVVSLKHSTA